MEFCQVEYCKSLVAGYLGVSLLQIENYMIFKNLFRLITFSSLVIAIIIAFSCGSHKDESEMVTLRLTPQETFNPISHMETEKTTLVSMKGEYKSVEMLLTELGIQLDDPPGGHSQNSIVFPSRSMEEQPVFPSFFYSFEEWLLQEDPIIVFLQPDEESYNTLPGDGKNIGVEYTDKTCGKVSAEIVSEHIMFCGQDSETIDVHTGGCFTEWPDDAVILLRRSDNDKPLMFVYEWGSGINCPSPFEDDICDGYPLIVTTLCPDIAFGKGESTEDERILVRDVINWAKNMRREIPIYTPNYDLDITVEVESIFNSSQEEFPSFNHGDVISIPFEIRNKRGTITSDEVVFSIDGPSFGPSHHLAKVYSEIPISIEPFNSATVEFTLTESESLLPGRYDVFPELYYKGEEFQSVDSYSFFLGLTAEEGFTYAVNVELIDPYGKTAKETRTVIVYPQETEFLHFAYEDLSSLGIWEYSYEILNYRQKNTMRGGWKYWDSFAICESEDTN